MTEAAQQVDAFVTPGTMLQAARQAQNISEREAADRLNMMPGYVAILERDDYNALRSPAFARGYVKAYGKMLGLDETELLDAFDRLRNQDPSPAQKRIRTTPLQLQHTGAGVVVGLAVLLLLVLALWWWRADQQLATPDPGSSQEEVADTSPDSVVTGEP